MSQVANCDRLDFQEAIESAYSAQKLFWESSTGTSRGALLRKWYELILENVSDSEYRRAPMTL